MTKAISHFGGGIMIPFRLTIILASLACITAGLNSSAPAQTYTVRDLGTQLGHTAVLAFAINNKGHVIGETRNAGNTQRRGFFIAPPYSIMSTIGVYEDHTFSRADGISNAGVVVGSTAKVGQSFRLIWGNGVLAAFPNAVGKTTGNLYDINDLGLMVGNSGGDGYSILDGQSSPLGTLASYSFAFPNAVNRGGAIVGYCNDGPDSDKATQWVSGVPMAIEDLGGSNSIAWDIADNGMIVGESEKPGSSNRIAFFKMPGESPVEIGTLGSNSIAYSTNGTTVVGTSNSTLGPQAIIFEGGELKNLNHLIPPGSGWNLVAARGINDHGQICGYGGFMGETRAFLLTPINPIGSAADWIFTERDNGWTAATNIPPFEPAEAAWTPGLGYGIRATGFPSFGFLQSPEVPLRPGRTYRLWVIVANTATGANAAPQIRLRAFQTNNNQATFLALDSVSNVIPSSGAGVYEYSFSPLFSGALPSYRFYLDFTHFNPEDEQNAWVYLQRIILAEE